MAKDIVAANDTILLNNKEMNTLCTNFSSYFTVEDTFDIEHFKEFLSNKISVTGKDYELKFLDSTYEIVPDEEHNSKLENKDSKNIYISGDNLDGLKILIKSYAHSIKCIYIDPPYNTGSDDFIYNDSFRLTPEEISMKLCIDKDQVTRICDPVKKGSASHSAWLMFMYPRLTLARDLLTEDGVIFISIDDNECHKLKLLCDDIYGEENFVAELIWEKKKKGTYLSNGITNVKESILVYSKNKNKFNGLIGEIKTNEVTYPCINSSNRRDVRHIPAGIESRFREKNFLMKAGEIISNTTMTLTLKSDLVIKDGVLAQDLDIEGNWRYSQDAMNEYVKNGEIYITQDLYLRRIVKKPRYKGLKDLLLRVGDKDDTGYSYDFDEMNLHASGWGSNEDANKEQRLLLGEQSLMSYPKPVLLIMKLITSVRDDNMTICDFFSGSATTAEAIMRLASKGKNYKYIMIQLPENLDETYNKATGDSKNKLKKVIEYLNTVKRPHTLDQLGIERIIKAAEKIKNENPDTIADLGFKHYTLKKASANTFHQPMEYNTLIT